MGRKKHRSFVMLERRVLNSEEWKNLTVFEMVVYIRIKHNFDGSNNGAIPFHYKELLGTMCRDSIAKALSGLIKKDWIKKKMEGRYWRYQCFYRLTWKHDTEQ